MKKFFLLLLLLFSAQIICAQQYYVPYPLTATQTYNGTQYRVECSVYDSSLATTFYYSTPYYDTYTFSNYSGMVSYNASNCSTTNNMESGAILYDFLIHQWKTIVLSAGDCAQQLSLGGSGSVFSYSYYTNNFQDYEVDVAGYYDLMHHQFYSISETSGDGGFYPTVNLSGIYGYTNDNHPVEPIASTSILNLKTGGFSYLGSGIFPCGGYASFNELTSVIDNSDCWNKINVEAFDPEQCISCSFTHANDNYSADKGIYIVHDDTTQQVYYGKYDAAFHVWEEDSFPSADISSWVLGQNVIAFKNSTNNMVISSVFNFNQHRWILDSMSTTAVNTLVINNGTVTWNDGSGTITRGYDPATGWGNYNTTLTPMFYVSDVSSASSGNLIFIRDYSVGATSYSVDFGDGIINSYTNNWHLYKLNGSYIYVGSAMQDTICYTASNSSGSATLCIPIPCFKPIATITTPSLFYCPGDSVLLTANSGLAYQWLQNGAAITNSTSQSIYVSMDGKYQCIVTDSCTSKYSNVLNVRSVSTISGATITALSSTTTCSNTGYLKISAGPNAPGTTFTWMRDTTAVGVNSSSLNLYPQVPGNYYCILSNACNTDTSNSIYFNIHIAPVASISTGGITTFCANDSLLINAISNPGCFYQWRKNGFNIVGANDSLYYAKNGGSYQCLVSDSFCTSYSGTVYLYTISVPTAHITALGPTTFCAPGSVTLQTPSWGSSSYQWLRNGINISGATNNMYTATSTGNYTVYVNYNGCDSTSLPIFVNVPCLPAPGGGSNTTYGRESSLTDAENAVTLFPNPTNGNFKLEILNSKKENITVTVFDVIGKKVSANYFNNNSGYNEHKMDLQKLNAGVYFVEVNFSSGKKIFKLIKE